MRVTRSLTDSKKRKNWNIFNCIIFAISYIFIFAYIPSSPTIFYLPDQRIGKQRWILIQYLLYKRCVCNISPAEGGSSMEILSRRLKDSMAPEGQNFHIAPNLGGRNDILSFLLLSEVWKSDLTKLVWPARTVWVGHLSNSLGHHVWPVCLLKFGFWSIGRP